MEEWIKSYLPLLLSACALGVSIWTWRLSRVVYEVITIIDAMGKDALNKYLSTGRYAILHVQSDPSNVLRTIYTLGKVSNK
jgi:hypothetical protein